MCWVEVSICAMLLGCMTDEISTVAEAVMQYQGIWVAEADVLGRICLYAPSWKYELIRNRLAMCELLNYEMIVDLCYELS